MLLNAGADVYSSNDRGSDSVLYPMGRMGWSGMAVTSTTLESRLHRVGFGLIKASIGILALEAALNFKRPISTYAFLTGLDT